MCGIHATSFGIVKIFEQDTRSFMWKFYAISWIEHDSGGNDESIVVKLNHWILEEML